ncbi:hypothetical protein [Siphonobacter sp. SORGH_AS_1065]|uniref:hypothetical protein n=1 Tax=Siphonobacter sp. SORGH_AS_1065 TaxID=3041795 RepID=UPI00278A1229|nr:hypothetical protein [Siphonobacter sp. SORGH_AS_1065]MDQ1090474.1 hypothetical protein [Siphonobacter sp. SORGH_AS_1065]
MNECYNSTDPLLMGLFEESEAINELYNRLIAIYSASTVNQEQKLDTLQKIAHLRVSTDYLTLGVQGAQELKEKLQNIFLTLEKAAAIDSSSLPPFNALFN